MTDTFAALPEEKRLRVLMAALLEFGRKGYDDASTNAIAAEAGVSKGSVFVYFRSKKEMYLYAVRWAMKMLQAELFDRVRFGTGDFFARASQVSDLKLVLLARYPPLANFLLSMVRETSAAVAADARALWGGVMGKAQALILKGLDENLFRADIPFPRILEMIRCIVGMYEQKVRLAVEQRLFDETFLAEWNAEWNELVAIMRKLFYKGGGAR